MVKSKAEVVQATKNEIQSTWRVYVKEWLFEAEDCTEATLADRVLKQYEGRLLPDDWRILEDPEEFRFVLQVRLWNVKAEWKHKEEADEHVRLLRDTNVHPEAEAVARNSRREQVLKAYGKLMLPAEKEAP